MNKPETSDEEQTVSNAQGGFQKAAWIVENITRERSFMELAEAIRSEGHDLFEINGDYTSETIAALRAFAASRPSVIFEGSINMRELVEKDVKNIQVFGTWERYACSCYYWRFGDLLFNDRYAIMPLGDIHRNPVVNTLSKSGAIFIRPNSGEKQFQARLLDLCDLRAFQEGKASSDTLVVISTPKTIEGEWRFVCAFGGEMVAYSSYRIKTRPVLEASAPVGAIELCRRVLEQNYFPDELFVVDICADADGTFWLLELNAFTSAGLYACNKRAIVRAVARMADG